MKKQTFPLASFAEWKAAAEASLKGEPIVKVKTAEGIELKPLYTKADTQLNASLPGEKPYTRGFSRVFSFPEPSVQLEADLLSAGAAAGVFPDESMLQIVHNKSLRTINTVPYHMAGATAVQELAVALSEAVFFVDAARRRNKAVPDFLVHFAAGPFFFTEVAKIRAFRTLWAAFMEAYKLDDAKKPKISVETSAVTLSILDPHVNILRTGSAAFSAVLGNIDYLYVRPFDEVAGKATELSERVAHNIPRLLKHEALLGKVADPAGGSYYIESLTEEIGRLAWDLFAEMEESGGIKQALTSGALQSQISAAQAMRQRDVANRKQQLIGINIYADPAEKPVNDLTGKKMDSKIKGKKIVPLTPKRLAEPFELLRQKSASLQQTGRSVKAGLICLGDLKLNKKRVDFAAGVLAAGGIEAVRSTPCQTVEEAVQFAENHPFPYYCICGADSAYKDVGELLVENLKKSLHNAVIDVAGKWELKGADGAIAEGDDMLRKLSDLLSLYEGDEVT